MADTNEKAIYQTIICNYNVLIADSFFVSGGRYGRSERVSKALPKLVEMVPRMDRFYWGSRYGKRSSQDYRTVASVNRFSAVLNFMNQVKLDRQNEARTGTNFDLLS